MKQRLQLRDAKPVLQAIALVTVVVLCSPITLQFVMALQTVDLPQNLSSFIRYLMALSLMMLLVWGVAAIGSPIFSIGLLFQRQYHRHIPRCLTIWVISWGSLPIMSAMPDGRKPGLIRATQRAQPLIAAIEAYRTKNGQYPPQLEALTPEFITAIPSTGMVGYPIFRYHKSDKEDLFRTYEIFINTTQGMFSFDRFVFWPEGNYPPQMYGGRVERIRKWAYVHE
ncbi:MAG TPA: hypothetical protein VF719_13790 [Abditibacteriaceae bacterium]|jgi:hypothetical protein